ncbi:MAG: RDD family protein [Thermoleophilia bacterium]
MAARSRHSRRRADARPGLSGAFVDCRRCFTRVTADAPHCPECGADPRTGLPSLKRGTMDRVRVCQGVWIRCLALALDRVVLAGVFFLVALVVFLALNGAGDFAVVGEEPSSRPLWLLFGAAGFAYFWFCEAVWGRTLGKRVCDLRVVRKDGSRPRAGAVFVRTALRAVDWLPFAYAVGALAVVVTPRRQRLGDLAAGTVVVRCRLVAVDRLADEGRATIPWPGPVE